MRSRRPWEIRHSTMLFVAHIIKLVFETAQNNATLLLPRTPKKQTGEYFSHMQAFNKVFPGSCFRCLSGVGGWTEQR